MKKYLFLVLIAGFLNTSAFALTKTDQVPVKGKTVTVAISAAINGQNVSFGSKVITLADFTVPYTYTIPDAVPTPTPIPEPTPAPVTRPFAQSSFWNRGISNEPIHANSAGLVAELAAQRFGPPAYGAPNINTSDYNPVIVDVTTDITKVPVSIRNDNYSTVAKRLLLGVPIPVGVQQAAGLDGHLVIADWKNDIWYEFWQMKQENGVWICQNAGIYQGFKTGVGIMPTIQGEWNASTASRLPNTAIRLSDLKAGVIPYAVPLAIFRPKAHPSFKWPAQATDGWYTGPNAIEEGQRFRFPQNITINPNWAPIVKMLVIAIRDYGLVVRDKAGTIAFVCEDARHLAPANTVDKAGWAWQQYKPFFQNPTGTKPEHSEAWYLMLYQFPWDKLEAVA